MNPIDPKFKSFVVNLLRRGTYIWKPRSEAFARARVERGVYKCEKCGALRKVKEVVADHIECVVDPKVGFVSWDEYVKRLFCQSDNFQILCKETCHKEKTKFESEQRKYYKRINKKKTTEKKSRKRK